MEQNPYQSPTTQTAAVGVNSGKWEDLISIAFYQKGIVVCVMLYFLFAILMGVTGKGPDPDTPFNAISLFFALAVLLVILTGMVFVILLTAKVFGVPMVILFAILSLIPCVGLILLLVVNNKATKVLNENGVKVGFFGANLAKMRTQGSNIPNDPV